MLPPVPRRSSCVRIWLDPTAVSVFPDSLCGSTCASSFSRFAQRSLTLRPAHSRCHRISWQLLPEGFSHIVTSIAAPVATGWSRGQVGLTPTGKRRLCTAHSESRLLAQEVVRRFSAHSGRIRDRTHGKNGAQMETIKQTWLLSTHALCLTRDQTPPVNSYLKL
jgi:hypothetical protein